MSVIPTSSSGNCDGFQTLASGGNVTAAPFVLYDTNGAPEQVYALSYNGGMVLFDYQDSGSAKAYFAQTLLNFTPNAALRPFLWSGWMGGAGRDTQMGGSSVAFVEVSSLIANQPNVWQMPMPAGYDIIAQPAINTDDNLIGVALQQHANHTVSQIIVTPLTALLG